jgi:Sodium/hydrogen exchanger family
MSTDQVLLGVGLIVVLAVGSQVLASRLRIPALIILLSAGFIAGALTTDVNPERLLGAAFQPLVSLAVAVILYDSGLALQWGKVTGRARRVVPRLVIWGVPVTMAFAAVLAGPLLGMSAGAAVMTGAILVVSGPTVVGPLLAFVRPADRLQRILSWEAAGWIPLPRPEALPRLAADRRGQRRQDCAGPAAARLGQDHARHLRAPAARPGRVHTGRDRGRFLGSRGLHRPGDDVAAGQPWRDGYASKYSSNSCGCGRSRIGSISPERL